MPRLPLISGLVARKAFVRLGWEYRHSTGSHMILEKPGQEATLSIPNHKELGRGLLKALIRASGSTEAEFLAALKK